jgi:hypothetical protein
MISQGPCDEIMVVGVNEELFAGNINGGEERVEEDERFAARCGGVART